MIEQAINPAVSTHSRPKAAGPLPLPAKFAFSGFNTQPPEGGWFSFSFAFIFSFHVSTHSRPKAAGASLKSLAPSGFAVPISLSS